MEKKLTIVRMKNHYYTIKTLQKYFFYHNELGAVLMPYETIPAVRSVPVFHIRHL
jgi:hypothetical protein